MTPDYPLRYRYAGWRARILAARETQIYVEFNNGFRSWRARTSFFDLI